MAKKGTLTHRKTRRLARRLGLMLPCTMGVMEALWHACSSRTPRGDIGSLTNQDIADEMFWDEDADELIDALVQAGLLDEHPEHRLVVHDWAEHADDTVHRALARKGECFADGSTPKLNKLTSAERAKAEAAFSRPQAAQAPVYSQAGQPQGNPTTMEADFGQPVGSPRAAVGLPLGSPWDRSLSHGLSLSHGHGESTSNGTGTAASDTGDPPDPAPVRARVPPDAEKHWQEFLELYPARNGDLCRAKGKEKFRQLLRSGVDPGVILDGARRYRQWADAAGKSGTEYVQQIPTWLNRRSWEEPWTLPARASPPARGKPPLTLAEEAERLAEETIALLSGGETYAETRDGARG